jgi:hypothetical protein
VLICSQSVPGSIASSTNSPTTTCSTASASASIVTIASVRDAPSAGSHASATPTPDSTSGCTFSSVRFQARTSCPASARRYAMGPPMIPVPRTAMVAMR